MGLPSRPYAAPSTPPLQRVSESPAPTRPALPCRNSLPSFGPALPAAASSPAPRCTSPAPAGILLQNTPPTSSFARPASTHLSPKAVFVTFPLCLLVRHSAGRIDQPLRPLPALLASWHLLGPLPRDEADLDALVDLGNLASVQASAPSRPAEGGPTSIYS